MPTYEYECTQCHTRTEVVQKFSDAPLTVCETCGGELRKVFSAVGIVFKGSGFYKTDSRGTSVSTSPSSSDTASSTSTAESSSSSTPAATTTPPATPAPAKSTPSAE